MKAAILVTVTAAALLTGCAATSGNVGNDAPAGSKSSSSSSAKKDKNTHTVVYKVAGTAKRGSLTYNTDGSTGQAQDTSVKLPWTKTFTWKGSFLIGQISAQNAGRGTISCQLLVDGKVVKANKSTGQYAIVSCDASIT